MESPERIFRTKDGIFTLKRLGPGLISVHHHGLTAYAGIDAGRNFERPYSATPYAEMFTPDHVQGFTVLCETPQHAVRESCLMLARARHRARTGDTSPEEETEKERLREELDKFMDALPEADRSTQEV